METNGRKSFRVKSVFLRSMDFLIGNKTLDEIYGSINVDMRDDGKELKTLDEKRGSDAVSMDEFKTLDEIYGSYNADMDELKRSDAMDGFGMRSRRVETLDNMTGLNVDDDDEAAFDCNAILSPGTEVSACVKNDGSCIPLRKLGSLEIPAIITGNSVFSHFLLNFFFRRIGQVA